MSPKQIVEQLRQQRESWVDLGEGKRVKIRRPSEGQMRHFNDATGVGQAVDFVVDWEGYTEADFLGAAVGSTDPLPFDVSLWAEHVGDDLELAVKVAKAVGLAVETYFESKQGAAKN